MKCSGRGMGRVVDGPLRLPGVGRPSRTTMTRTFIALELNDSLQRFLGKIMRQMAQELPNIRWVDPSTIHLTLAFLGDLNDERLAVAMQATEVAAQQVTPFVWSL